jgi:hypothetical protein
MRGKVKPSIFRVQDREGRGPWRLGLSAQWSDPADPPELLLPWHVEFGPWILPPESERVGKFYGCGTRDLEQLRRWFSPTEYRRLLDLGFAVVRMDVDRILAESRNQLVFERARAMNKGVVELRLYPALQSDNMKTNNEETHEITD